MRKYTSKFEIGEVVLNGYILLGDLAAKRLTLGVAIILKESSESIYKIYDSRYGYFTVHEDYLSKIEDAIL